MNAAEKQRGDDLAQQLIEEYWSNLTNGIGGYSDFHDWPLHYTPHDRWATREQWIKVATQCLRNENRVIFALGLLLDEGFTEHLDAAIAFVTKWAPEWDKYYWHSDWLTYGTPPLEPAALDNLIKRLPRDHLIRREYLPADNPDELDEEGRRALISVEDEVFCRNLAACIERVFFASELDTDQVEDYALPRMMELGRLCAKYIDPAVMDAAKRFCLDYLEKDREMAPRFRQLLDTKDPPRFLWIYDRIAPLAWRIGWLDILTNLRNEPWYWNKDLWNLGGTLDISFMDEENLLVWSQYVDNDLLRERALHVMSRQPRQMDGAIAWVRMSHVRWPPD